MSAESLTFVFFPKHNLHEVGIYAGLDYISFNLRLYIKDGQHNVTHLFMNSQSEAYIYRRNKHKNIPVK